jgi:hypothetical protein
MLAVIGGALIALPLALQESTGTAARDRTVVVTKRSLILALWRLVVFIFLYYEYGQSFNMLAAVCLVLPLALAASRAWGARRGRIELGLLRHPLRRKLRAHLVQGLNSHDPCLPPAGDGSRSVRRGAELLGGAGGPAGAMEVFAYATDPQLVLGVGRKRRGRRGCRRCG